MKLYEHRKGDTMNTYKLYACNYLVRILICTFSVLFIHILPSYSAERILVWPSNEVMVQLESNKNPEAHELRKGKIELSPDILPKQGSLDKKAAITPAKRDDDTVSINLFSDVNYDVIVDSVKHHADGTTIINGRLKDHKIETVVITIDPEGFLITVQDMKKGLLYRAKGDSRTGIGMVTEIDIQKMPPMIR